MSHTAHTRADGPHENWAVSMLYTWGIRTIGAALLVGIALQLLTSADLDVPGSESRLASRWAQAVLIGLWSVPVLSLLVIGWTWIVRDRRDIVGWAAIAISVFLCSLWILT